MDKEIFGMAGVPAGMEPGAALPEGDHLHLDHHAPHTELYMKGHSNLCTCWMTGNIAIFTVQLQPD